MTIYTINIQGETFFRWFNTVTRENVLYEFNRAIEHIRDSKSIDFGMLETVLTKRDRRKYAKQIWNNMVWELTIKILKQWDSKSKFSMFETYTNYFGRRYLIQQVNNNYYLSYEHTPTIRIPDITDCRKLIKNYVKLHHDSHSKKYTKPVETVQSTTTYLDF